MGATQASAFSRQEISVIWTSEEIVQAVLVTAFLGTVLKEWAHSIRHLDARWFVRKSDSLIAVLTYSRLSACPICPAWAGCTRAAGKEQLPAFLSLHLAAPAPK